MHLQCVGYHGTSQANATLILKNSFTPSNPANWFGQGIYFFGDLFFLANGKQDAKRWVKAIKNETKWAVIRAEIDSKSAFDMVRNESHKRAFLEMRKKLFDLHLKAGNDPLYFKDRIVFIAIENANAYEVIRAIVDPTKIGYIAYAVPRLQVQICVKDPTVVKRSDIIMQGD